MSELLAVIEKNIASVVNNTRTEKGMSAERRLYRIIRRYIPARGKFKILSPYSTGELLCPLLEVNHALELVCLATKRQLMEKKETRDRIFFLNDELRSVRAKADFDLVFCSLLQIEGEVDRLSEDLCHCRMLLKPGGQLLFHVRNGKGKSLKEILGLERGVTVTEMFLRAGLGNIVERRLPQGQIFCSGRRPPFTF